MKVVEQLAQDVGTSKACDALDVSRASLYRQRNRQAEPARDAASKRSSSRALPESEREQVRQTLYSERFMDKSPYQVYATLLDDGEYLCSVRTMYRILEENNASKERRNPAPAIPWRVASPQSSLPFHRTTRRYSIHPGLATFEHPRHA